VSGEGFLALLLRPWLNGPADDRLNLLQLSGSVANRRPDHARKTRRREEPDPFGLQLEHRATGAGVAQGCGQLVHAIHLHVAEKHERQVKLPGPGPAHAILRQRAPQFGLRSFNFAPDGIRQRNGDEQAPGCRFGVHMKTNARDCRTKGEVRRGPHSAGDTIPPGSGRCRRLCWLRECVPGWSSRRPA